MLLVRPPPAGMQGRQLHLISHWIGYGGDRDISRKSAVTVSSLCNIVKSPNMRQQPVTALICCFCGKGPIKCSDRFLWVQMHFQISLLYVYVYVHAYVHAYVYVYV